MGGELIRNWVANFAETSSSPMDGRMKNGEPQWLAVEMV